MLFSKQIVDRLKLDRSDPYSSIKSLAFFRVTSKSPGLPPYINYINISRKLGTKN